MADSRTFWLVLTNLALGALVLLAVGGVLISLVRECVARHRKRHRVEAELDHDMEEMFGHHPRPRN